MALPPILVELKMASGEFMSKMGEARHEISKLERQGGSNYKKLAVVGKAAFLGLGVAAVAAGGIAIKAALDGEQAHERLRVAIENAGGSMKNLGPRIEELVPRFAKLGYTNDELEAALGTLTTSLRDPQKALQNVGLAADLARYKNISLNDAALLVAKGLQGQIRPLKQLGIDLPITSGGAANLAKATRSLHDAQGRYALALQTYNNTTGKAHVKALKALEYAQLNLKNAQQKVTDAQRAGTVIQQALTKALHGQADAAAKTYAGRLREAKAQVENLAERLGTMLLPIIARVVGWVAQAIGWFQKHSEVTKIVAAAIAGVLVPALVLYVIEMGAAAVATIAATWPILLIIAALAAVGVAIYELVKHWHTVWGFIKRIALDVWHALVGAWNAAWGAIKGVLQSAWQVLRPVFMLIWNVGLLPIRLYIRLLMAEWAIAWDVIKTVLHVVWSIIKPVLNDVVHVGLAVIKQAVHDLGNAFSTVWHGIQTVINTVWGVIKPILHAMKQAIDDTVGAVGKVASVASKVGGGIFHFVDSHLPGGHAVGTGYTDGGLAMVGEYGPEVVQLPRGSRVWSHGTGPTGGGGGVTVHINGPVYGTTSRELALKVRDALLDLRRSSGQTLGFT